MTVIGEDRPGLVESIAALVAEHQGNWLDSRMSRLGGQFAGILQVEVPSEKATALAIALHKLSANGLTVVVHPDRQAQHGQRRRLAELDIVGQDRPGIVRQITRVLAERAINVEELHTERSSAAMSGEMIFRARAILCLPESCSAPGLLRELETIAADLIVDVSLSEVAPAKTPAT